MTAGIRKGNETAFGLTYQTYHAGLYCYALKFVKSDELAKDIVHDVFLKLWENRSHLNKELSLKGYLFRICKNHVLNLLKRAAHETSIKEKILSSSGCCHGETENAVCYTDYHKVALQAIEKLPPQRQAIFKMCKLEGRSYEEVAKGLGISKGTVRDHIFKASRYIKEYLTLHADLTLGIIIIFLCGA